ncbi:DUF3772 domain-containing protein [Psychromarinibacter sp. C21-152]|uniref:DUF3772 domain-containing protein n=1 Tax=Psychromarinibacter sediminicola TaxID=3033385 RepID=A0AAE3TAW5_9RHOB|nr:DUF3772 domain-containing protein [Psychromarinibacter sediminicola]MDF0602020.1 DUF3772 domain-containing protein [Psychromarinibacter sediminicola]
MSAMLARFLLVLCLGLAIGGAAATGPVFAQEAAAPETIDYEAWERVATRAEAAVDSARASNEALETLRAEIDGWRERFLQAQTVNASRIETLRAQIEALGPAPAEGEAEVAELSERRQTLNQQLSEALAPVRRAEEAFSRAEGLIRRIDALIRLRQADALLSIGPSPLNPAIWPDAVTAFVTSVRAVWTEMQAQWASEVRRESLRQQLPQTILYIVIAGALLLRGRPAMVKLTQAVLTRSKGRARALAAFITSLFQVVLPVLGLALLAAALQATGMLGIRGEVLVRSLTVAGFSVFVARWLSQRLYPIHPDAPRPMPVPADGGRGMRFYTTMLGVLVGLFVLIDGLVEYESYSEATQAVVYFPLILVSGLIFVRIGRILTTTARPNDPHGEAVAAAFAHSTQRLIGQALVLVGFASPLLAAIGYLNAADFVIQPMALTLLLLGVLRVFHDLVVELHALFTGRTAEESHQALGPSAVSFLLVLASVPLFALIWGARVADLTEIWAMAREGVMLGDTRLSPGTLLTLILVFIVLYAATRLFQGALKSTILPKTKLDPGGQNAVISGIGYLGIFLAAILAVTAAGIDLSALAFVAGALSVGIGFGLQNVVSNFISGIILLVERPVAEGDWIEVGGHMGIVKDISVRSTRIETFDRNDVIVPNADFISGTVKNWTRGNVMGRIIVQVGVAYGTDTRKVQQILTEIAHEHPLVTLDPEPAVDFLEFGASSLDFQIRMVLRDIGYGLDVRTEIRHRIAERFAEEGIEIPFAQQDIWLRNPETLRPSAAAPQPRALPEAEDVPEAPSATATETVRGEDVQDGGGGEDQ